VPAAGPERTAHRHDESERFPRALSSPSRGVFVVVTCCWSVKGGSGVTVVAAALAHAASLAAATALVDLCGDVPAALGVGHGDGPGVAEWSRGHRGATPLQHAAVPIAPSLSLVTRGSGPLGALPLAAFDALAADIVVDAGCIDRADGPRAMLVARSHRSLLVTRPCYLSLRRAARLALRPDGIVLVVEPGRALQASDVAAVIGAPIVAELPIDPAVSRALDAGLLLLRRPASLFAAVAVAVAR
jgi:hypothetical protein